MMKTVFFLMLIVLSVPAVASAYTLKTYYQDGFPKYYYEGQGKISVVTGLCPEIMALIQEKCPEIKFEAPHQLVKFSRIKHDLYFGLIDVFLGMSRTAEREEQFIYLDPPLYTLSHVFAVRSDDPVCINCFDDIRKLQDKGIILTNHGTSSERFLKEKGGLLVDAGASTLAHNLEKLCKGRGRMVFFHDLGMSSMVREEKWKDKIKVLPNVFNSYSHFLVFSKHADPEAVRLVRKALSELAESGELQKITTKYFDRSN